MRKNLVRVLSFILVCLMAVSVMCACSDRTGNDAQTTAQSGDVGSDSTDGTKTTEKVTYAANIPEGTRYDDQTFTVYAYPKDIFVWYDYDWQNEGVKGETINDAVYQRTSEVEDLLGVKVEVVHAAAYTNCNDLTRMITSGEDIYDIANVNCLLSFQLAQNGYISELNSYGDIDLEAAWWDQNCIEGLSIHNKNFCLAGDIGTMYKRSIGAMIFNKSIFAKNPGLGNPYDYVKNGTWTLEQMISMASAVSEDLNGDGVRDTKDMYGLVYFQSIACTLPIGCGASYALKDANDEPAMSLYNEKIVDVINKSAALLYNKDISYNVTANGQDEQTMWDMFMADQALFYYGELHSAEDMRAMESEFGILPMPKYDANQESYYHSVNANVAAMLVIPCTNQQELMTSHVIDALGAASKNILTPAFYTKNLQGIVSRDEESTVSLDIIISTIKYDIGFLGIRATGNLLRSLNKSYSADLASAYTSEKSTFEATLKKIISDIDSKY